MGIHVASLKQDVSSNCKVNVRSILSMAIELYAKHLRIGVMFIKTALCKHLLAPITGMTLQIRYLVIQLKKPLFWSESTTFGLHGLFPRFAPRTGKKKALREREPYYLFHFISRIILDAVPIKRLDINKAIYMNRHV